jgi:mannan endo-1,4-beta-mannosidase
MKKNLFAIILASALCSCAVLSHNQSFAKVEDGIFNVGGKPVYYIGTNFWYGAILASSGEGGDTLRLIKELDLLKDAGVTNLRVLVGSDGVRGINSKVEPTLQVSPGVYNDTVLKGLDRLMAELAKRDMKAVLYLNNSWEWSGGYSQYLSWSGHGKAPIPNVDGWPAYIEYVKQFHKCDSCKKLFAAYVRDIVSRTNTITGVAYKDDPVIFSWQIGNEPRAFSNENKEPFAKWIGEVAKLIKSIDPNHMVSTGSEGKHGCEEDMELFEKIHSYPEIDYLNIHIWPYNWKWISSDSVTEKCTTAIDSTRAYIDDHLAIASKLGKPVVIEEFGYPRDKFLFAPGSAVTGRDKYYESVFKYILINAKKRGVLAGCNFWGWGGYAKPNPSNEFWMRGDDYTGDPAQEAQGLNSVFAADSSTIRLIKEYNQKLSSLKK